jgi:hypothetical protein
MLIVTYPNAKVSHHFETREALALDLFERPAKCWPVLIIEVNSTKTEAHILAVTFDGVEVYFSVTRAFF